ncbi:NUDIX hydrolase [Desulfovibrio psychrotolerans]|uniref:Isopentenyl-diphosphate Delta-isomerase n=1 Tax=Desulfovibrio psychrotolerans TaxID=415242 RepID=A0A7J0BQN9_9BACT|nr:NUDIX domain-containing protein [Desulfovibrio psychrotolerans]GFM35501.1 isopentenyl-diphosphate Delta-isomerase [Desulfovibrio psychrotolerans]
MIETIYLQLLHTLEDKVEVVDDYDRPLAVMPVADVHRHPLKHRVVLTLLYDTCGRLYLQRRARTKTLYPGRWDLSSTGHVLAGESREHAALRELNEELGVFPGKVTWVAHIPASKETELADITLFSARLGGDQPCPNPQEVSEGIFVDREELEAMLQNFREILTPAVIWAAEEDYLFRPAPTNQEADQDVS